MAETIATASRNSLRSLREIEDLTGFTFKKIKKKIGSLKPQNIEGQTHYYETKFVFPLLYKDEPGKEHLLKLDQERANLAAKQAEKTEIIIQQMRSELIPSACISEALNLTFTALRAKLLTLPSKTAMLLTGLTANEIESVLKENIYDALTELSNLDIRAILLHGGSDDREKRTDFDSPSEVHDFAMG